MARRVARRAPPAPPRPPAPPPALLLVAFIATARASLEVPLSLTERGLYEVEVSVGNPPKKVRVAVDSGSSFLWVPPHSVDGAASKGTPVKIGSYADGLTVEGIPLHEKVVIGNIETDSAPLVLATQLSRVGRAGKDFLPEFLGDKRVLVKLEDGKFQVDNSEYMGKEPGLAHCYSKDVNDKRVELTPWGSIVQGTLEDGWLELDGVSEEERAAGILGLGCPEEEDNGPAPSFFCYFWRQHPDLPKNIMVQYGGPLPRLVLGAELQEGARAEGGVRFVKDLYGSGDLWYVPVRAIGLSRGGRSVWSVDFNTAFPTGAAALLDSGASAIRLSRMLFKAMLDSLPECHEKLRSIECPCDSAADMPTLSISLEAAANTRFLGFDAGADFIACVPPSAYVSQLVADGKVQKTCRLAVYDGGHTSIFGTEGLVLGVPFFRAVGVAQDAERRRIGIGAPMLGDSLEPVEQQCVDPKNWFNTGRRVSLYRVSFVLVMVVSIIAYVVVSHSPRPWAVRARSLLAGLRARSRGGQALGSGAAGAAGAGVGGEVSMRMLGPTGGAAGTRSGDGARGLSLRQPQDQAFVALNSDNE